MGILPQTQLCRRLDDELDMGPLPRRVLGHPLLLLCLLHRRPHPPLRPRLRTVRDQVRQGLGPLLLRREVQVRPWGVLDEPRRVGPVPSCVSMAKSIGRQCMLVAHV